MSEAREQDGQRRPAPSRFAPYPNLELRDAYGTDVFLIVPHSADTHEVRCFQVFGQGGGRDQDFIGKVTLNHLLTDLKNGQASGNAIAAIRRFYTE